MKIYLDNQLEVYKKIVYIEAKENKTIDDDLNTIVDALLAYGYDMSVIQKGMAQKLIDWKVIEPINSDTNTLGDYYKDIFDDGYGEELDEEEDDEDFTNDIRG